jgi:phosphohistidine swiveling domain-containing protein
MYGALTPDAVDSLPFETLAGRTREIIRTIWTGNANAFYSLWFDKDFCKSVLAEAGSSISNQRVDELWTRLTEPVADSFEKRREARVLQALQRGDSWAQLASTFQYYAATYLDVAPLPAAESFLREHYASLLGREAQALERAKNERAQREKRHADFTATLTAEERKLAEYLQTVMDLRDRRKDPIAQATTVAFRTAQRVWRQTGLDDSLRLYVLLDEILQGPDYLRAHQDEITKRSDGFACLVRYDGTIETAVGGYDEDKQRLDALYLGQHAADTSVREITGQVGCLGRAIGRVRIVRRIQDGAAFQPGEPEFVPLMGKAAAIVTDEGGVTSHAAIVAREMNKPCIIGTKIATRVLRDGETVEVDADHGIIKRLDP